MEVEVFKCPNEGASHLESQTAQRALSMFIRRIYAGLFQLGFYSFSLLIFVFGESAEGGKWFDIEYSE